MTQTYNPVRVEDGVTITQVTGTGKPRKEPVRQRPTLEGSEVNRDFEAALARSREHDAKHYHKPAWRDGPNDPTYGKGIGGPVKMNADGSPYVAPTQRRCIDCSYPLKDNKVRNGGEHGFGCYVFNNTKLYGNPYVRG